MTNEEKIIAPEAQDGEESVVTETLAELFNSSSESKSAETMPMTNPGDAPPPK